MSLGPLAFRYLYRLKPFVSNVGGALQCLPAGMVVLFNVINSIADYCSDFRRAKDNVVCNIMWPQLVSFQKARLAFLSLKILYRCATIWNFEVNRILPSGRTNFFCGNPDFICAHWVVWIPTTSTEVLLSLYDRIFSYFPCCSVDLKIVVTIAGLIYRTGKDVL